MVKWLGFFSPLLAFLEGICPRMDPMEGDFPLPLSFVLVITLAEIRQPLLHQRLYSSHRVLVVHREVGVVTIAKLWSSITLRHLNLLRADLAWGLEAPWAESMGVATISE